MSISMFLKSQKAFFLALDPLRQIIVDLNNARDVLALYPGDWFGIIFSFLDGDQLHQSALVLQALLSHTAR